MFKRITTVISIFTITILNLYGQGCSDAGFCTMGAMQPDQEFNKNTPLQLRSIGINLYEGQANTSPSIKAAILDISFRVLQKIDIQFKVPYMSVSGNFGNTQGIGDLSLAATKSIKSTPDYDLLGTVGLKIPTGNSNKMVPDRDMVLPMYYQVTLGTYDLILGGSYINRNWLFSVGYQQPIIHQNKNTFTADPALWSWYEGGIDYVRRHAQAKDLKRGADLMIRVERNFRMSRFNFNVGLLPIYRISKDKGRNPAGQYEKLPGTTGLALSGLIGCGYNFNVSSSINLIVGYKITDRDYNPDGLTRKHVINFAYKYNF
jgi:hypothetical protein